MKMMTKKETWQKLLKLGLVFGKMPDGKWNIGGMGAANEHGMRGFDLGGADFSEASLGAGDFSGAILINANFSGTELYEAKFIKTNLNGANLTRTSLDDADLSLADLSDANLSFAFLLYANLSAANLKGAKLQESILDEVNLNRANLSRADITGSTFWGVSTAGWKIEGIKARYVYFCKNNIKDKENYRRNFKEGQFEALYRSLPTVEMVFAQGLSPMDLFTLSLMVEKINKQNPNFGVKMTDIHKNEFGTRVGIKINKDEDLGTVEQIIQDIIAQVASEISSEILTSYMAKILPNNCRELSNNTLQNPSSSVVVNIIHPTFQLIKADGSTLSGSISQSGALLNFENVIIKNYGCHKEELNMLFVDLKKSFDEYDVSARNMLTEKADRMIESLKNETNISNLQNVWEEIKEGIKTSGAAATIAATIARLLGLV
jgi:hypothetical protein